MLLAFGPEYILIMLNRLLEDYKIILLYNDTLKKLPHIYFILYKCWSHRRRKRS